MQQTVGQQTLIMIPTVGYKFNGNEMITMVGSNPTMKHMVLKMFQT